MDAHCAGGVLRLIDAATETTGPNIIVDAEALRFLDSPGSSALLLG